MVIDISALIAILLKEAEAEQFFCWTGFFATPSETFDALIAHPHTPQTPPNDKGSRILDHLPCLESFSV